MCGSANCRQTTAHEPHESAGNHMSDSTESSHAVDMATSRAGNRFGAQERHPSASEADEMRWVARGLTWTARERRKADSQFFLFPFCSACA
eukprot:3861716-Rhodomonas_salina.1